ASSGGLTGASAGYNMTAGSATTLLDTVRLTSTAAGASITPAIEVTARDANGNTATGFTGNVTLAIGTNAGGGVLSGTVTRAATRSEERRVGKAGGKVGTG